VKEGTELEGGRRELKQTNKQTKTPE